MVRGADAAPTVGETVAFEVDEIDFGSRTGWIVLVTGRAGHLPLRCLAHDFLVGQGELIVRTTALGLRNDTRLITVSGLAT